MYKHVAPVALLALLAVAAQAQLVTKSENADTGTVVNVAAGGYLPLQEPGQKLEIKDKMQLAVKFTADSALGKLGNLNVTVRRSTSELGYADQGYLDAAVGLKKSLYGDAETSDWAQIAPFFEMSQDFKGIPGYRQVYGGVSLSGSKTVDGVELLPAFTAKYGGDTKKPDNRGWVVNPAIKVKLNLVGSMTKSALESRLSTDVYGIYNGYYHSVGDKWATNYELGGEAILKLSGETTLTSAISYLNGRTENVFAKKNTLALTLLLGSRCRL